MKYIILNIIAWIVVLGVVLVAVFQTGSYKDSRIKTIFISSQEPQDSLGVTQINNEDSNRIEQEQEDKILFTNDDTDSTIYYSSNPDAVKLNDSSLMYFETQNYKKAIELLKETLVLDSTYARAYYNLGVAFHKSNKIGNAIKAYEQAYKFRPYYYEPVYNLGVLYASIDKTSEAINWFIKASEIKSNSTSSSAHYNLGILYNKIGDLVKSEKSYRESLRLKPDYIEARFNLALLQIDQADYKTAIQELEKCKNLGFNKSKLYRNLGLCYSKLEEFDKAVLANQIRAELDSTNAVAWYNLAVLYKKVDKNDNAIKSYLKCLEVDSSYYQASYNLASLYSNLNMKDSALIFYQQAALSNNNYSKAYYNIAIIYYDIEKYDSAITYYNKVVELDPENMNALYNLGLSYNKLDQTKEAVEAYIRLIDNDPTNTKGLYNLGTAYLNLNLFDSALVYFNRLANLSQQPNAYYNRAKANNELGNFEEAKFDYRKAIELKPDYAKAYHNLAILEEKSENYNEAVDLLLKALEYEADNWKTHWKLGQVLVKMNRINEAMNEYASAANLKPDSDKFKKEYDKLFSGN